MADESDPPRVFYQLKPKEFERVNSVPESPSSMPLAGSENPPAPPPAKIDIHDLYAQAATPVPLLTHGERRGTPNEVHALLQDNLARANTAGLNDLAPKPRRRSRRLRDYLILVVPLDAFFGFAAFGPYHNVGTMAFGVAGLIVATLGIGWVMFVVMDRY